jgi:putative lipoprotein
VKGPRAAAFALLVGALEPAPARAGAPDPDPWFGHDKLLHFEASAAIAAAGYGGAAIFTDDVRLRLLAGGALGIAAGAGKELWDRAGHGDASWRDFTWDVIGTATGLAVAAAIDWAVGRLWGHRPPAVEPSARSGSAR